MSDREPPIARTPDPPYYAVIFTSHRTDADPEGYARTVEAMAALAARQPGFLGIESARGPDGLGITVSYWESEDAIRAWKQVPQHQSAQRVGRERWYRDYALRVCRIERAYTLESSRAVGLDEAAHPRG